MRAEPQRISVEQLIALFGHIRGCRIGVIYAETVPRLRQKVSNDDPTPCPWFNQDSNARQSDETRWFIRKQTTFSVAIVGNRRNRSSSPYESAVNNRRAREWRPIDEHGQPIEFRSQGRTWGKRRQSTPLVDYQGRVYLDVQRLRILSYGFIDIRDGRSVTQTQIAPWLIGATPGKSQQVDQSVIWRDYRIDRIRRVTGLNGQTYEIARRARLVPTRETRSQQIDRRRRLRNSANKTQKPKQSRRRHAA